MKRIENYPLRCSEYKNATLIATQVDRVNKTFSGGIYDRHGNIITDSLRQDPSYTGLTAFPQEITRTAQEHNIESIPNEIKGQYLYLGAYTYHYGHFLLESLSRIWAAQENNYTGFVFSEFVIQSEQFKSFTEVFLSRAGVDPKKTLIIKENTKFESLHIPTPLFYINNKAHHEYINTFKRISNPLKNGTLRIYLSRSNLKKRKRMVVNEKAIEQAFIEHGFIIVHPEKLSVEQQLTLYGSCHTLASLDGSALHNGVFLPRESRIINICTSRYPNKLNTNQSICNQLNDLKCELIPFQGEVIDLEKQVTRFDIPTIRRWLRKNT
ncbi:glycosyltransferase 61 family protein [Vibrio wakamikoensis]|uniref:glycosyltransferase family 61 protein n=1 Tax=Vibrio wakamikoensis TaxID=2910251 RepID=UPI003D1E2C69